MPSYNLANQAEGFTFYGKVVRSYLGPPGEEYIKASGGRAANTMQWHIEIEPMSFRYASGGVRTKSQNMPAPGMAPQKGSPLIARYEAFKSCGFNMPTEDDFKKIEGHIFFFTDIEKDFGRNKKRDDWPISCQDQYVPPPEVPIIGSADGGSSVDPWTASADILDGKGLGNEAVYLLQAGVGAVSGSVEVMTLANGNKLAEALVAKGLVTIADGIISRAKANASTP